MEIAHPHLQHLVAVACVFVAAGAVKGISGMGLPTVAVSLLGLWMPPAAAAALLVMPSLATNVAQCRGPYWRRLVSRLWPAWLALAIVTVLAPALHGTAFDARGVLGLVLIAYGSWGLLRPELPALSHRTAAARAATCATVGGATGIVTAMTAVFVLPLVPFLQSLRLEKDEMIQALGLSFTVATIALAARLQVVDRPEWLAPDVVAALVCAFAGMRLGARWRARLDAKTFQRCLFGVFVALGVANLVRAFG